MDGNQQACLLSQLGNCQNGINFPILVWELEINVYFPCYYPKHNGESY